MNIHLTIIFGIPSTHCAFVMPKLTEPNKHYLLFTEQRRKLLENLRNLGYNILSHCDDEPIQILLYGSSTCTFPTYNKLLSLTTEFLEST